MPEQFNLNRQITEFLKTERGLDLSGYRQNTLMRRINRRIADLNFADSSDYLAYLQENTSETDRLINAVTVNNSFFFRDPVVFDYIAHEILPDICLERSNCGNGPVNIWSCGCATGEEPYSMAILVKELPQIGLNPVAGAIYATDIDTEALRIAKKGCYISRKLQYAQLGHVKKYFSKNEDIYCIDPEIKKMISFSTQNVLSSEKCLPPESVFRHFDIILCRNLLIYMSPETQITLLKNLESSLSVGGYLILGETESLQGLFRGKFQQILGSLRIYRKIY